MSTKIKIVNQRPESEKATHHGYLTIDKEEVEVGETITITVHILSGFEFSSLSCIYTNRNNETVKYEVELKETVGTFTVPEDIMENGTVSIIATFVQIIDGTSTLKANVKKKTPEVQKNGGVSTAKDVAQAAKNAASDAAKDAVDSMNKELEEKKGVTAKMSIVEGTDVEGTDVEKERTVFVDTSVPKAGSGYGLFEQYDGGTWHELENGQMRMYAQDGCELSSKTDRIANSINISVSGKINTSETWLGKVVLSVGALKQHCANGIFYLTFQVGGEKIKVDIEKLLQSADSAKDTDIFEIHLSKIGEQFEATAWLGNAENDWEATQVYSSNKEAEMEKQKDRRVIDETEMNLSGLPEWAKKMIEGLE